MFRTVALTTISMRTWDRSLARNDDTCDEMDMEVLNFSSLSSIDETMHEISMTSETKVNPTTRPVVMHGKSAFAIVQLGPAEA